MLRRREKKARGRQASEGDVSGELPQEPDRSMRQPCVVDSRVEAGATISADRNAISHLRVVGQVRAAYPRRLASAGA
jgi:hypothetical protein